MRPARRAALGCPEIVPDGALLAPPAPIMPWMAHATLRGRVPAGGVPLHAIERFDALVAPAA